MRLLNTTTLQLEEFFDNEIPKYAILSHTWGKEEISFREWQQIQSRPQGNSSPEVDFLLKRSGYEKIRGACDAAANFENLRRQKNCNVIYVWIDTCCIDKTSSAELTEAINSMYKWYAKSEVCFAYLSDVPKPRHYESIAQTSYLARFAESRWFTRGWTLQELVAPAHVIFFSEGWHKISTKQQLCQQISDITGIDLGVLKGNLNLSVDVSVAKRMFWASKRNTTRVEDMAYSLIGLFDVNMPLLNGEGERAFTRLQEEIMKRSDDQSLFAWKNTQGRSECGLLASSPSCFIHSGEFVPIANPLTPVHPYAATNKGVCMQLYMVQFGGLFFALLGCIDLTRASGPETICLRPIPPRSQDIGNNQFMRVMDKICPETLHWPTLDHNLASMSTWHIRKRGWRTVYIIESDHEFDLPPYYRRFERPFSFHILQDSGSGETYKLCLAHESLRESNDVFDDEQLWDSENAILSMEDSVGVASPVLLSNPFRKHLPYVILTIGVDLDFKIVVRTTPISSLEDEQLYRTCKEEQGLLGDSVRSRIGNRSEGFTDVGIDDAPKLINKRIPEIDVDVYRKRVLGKEMWVIQLGYDF